MNACTVMELAEAVAQDGPEAHESELLALAERARCAACCPDVVIDVVADETAPPVLRQRALARVVAALVSPRTDRSIELPGPVIAEPRLVVQERESLRAFWHR